VSGSAGGSGGGSEGAGAGTAALRLAPGDPTPPYEQLRRQLADLIGAGVLATGDRLPPLRQLAADLGLAAGTVARTYRELEAAGLVVSRRGGGTRVAPRARRPEAQLRTALHDAAQAYVQSARRLGAEDVEIRDAVARATLG
jgi:DNA-binding transcriptional regulator YhcF (GntR family)